MENIDDNIFVDDFLDTMSDDLHSEDANRRDRAERFFRTLCEIESDFEEELDLLANVDLGDEPVLPRIKSYHTLEEEQQLMDYLSDYILS